MNKLKELTWAHHQAAERRAFAKTLIKGDIDPLLYYKFLVAQYQNYSVLEEAATIPEHLEAIKRAPRIKQDIDELIELYGFGPIDLPRSVEQYKQHIQTLSENGDNEALLAHMYTRHFGELHGGQIIKKNVPGSGAMYEFDGDKTELIAEFRKLLNDDMATEAKICFEFASRLFDELSS